MRMQLKMQHYRKRQRMSSGPRLVEVRERLCKFHPSYTPCDNRETVALEIQHVYNEIKGYKLEKLTY